MFQEIIHTIATKIALISIAVFSVFNPNFSLPEDSKSITIVFGTGSTEFTETGGTENIFSEFGKISFPKLSNIEKLIPTLSPNIPAPRIPIAEDRPRTETTTPDENNLQTEVLVPEKLPTVETTDSSNKQISFDVITEKTRNALVNILCSTNINSIGKTTGSGVIIDSKGIILTNAHVAQLYLLDKQRPGLSVECIIRTGNPAKPTFRAELLYISPTWINTHPDTLIQTEPRGTGENDFAFLRITESYDRKTPLPNSFPFVEPDINYEPNKDDVLILASYPAGILDGIGIINSLRLETVAGYVTDIFTFKQDTIDLFEIRDSVVAQKGSSGGAVVNNKNKLSGIIVTSVRETSQNQTISGLRAITPSHINRALIGESGQSLNSLLSGDTKNKAQTFQSVIAPLLSKILADTIFK